MIKVYGYTKCSTVKKALKFLDQNNVEYQFIDFVINPMSATEIKNVHLQSKLPIKSLFNTSGLKYRELALKDKVALMSDQECYDLLSTDGMLVKRPMLVSDTHVLVGFKEINWQEVI